MGGERTRVPYLVFYELRVCQHQRVRSRLETLPHGRGGRADVQRLADGSWWRKISLVEVLRQSPRLGIAVITVPAVGQRGR